MMSLFAPDACVVMGPGVEYSGVHTDVHKFYENRFKHSERYACGIHENIREFKPWVVFSGNIIDHAEGKETYRGPFLHVWRIEENKIKSLNMFFE